MTSVTRTTCPYCGVGCGIVVSRDEAGGEITVGGDPLHPANYGRLCSKGAALGETLGPEGRLLYPEVDGRRVAWETALDRVADGFRHIIEQHGPGAVALYVSGQLLTEDYYVANKLMKGYIGSANIDTNSRLCMSSTVAGHKRAFGCDAVPCSYEDLEQASLVVLVGSNAAWCHPVLYQRIVQAKRDRGDLRVVVIDPRRTATCDVADLHLPLRSGSDGALFNGLLLYLADSGAVDDRFVASSTEGLDTVLAEARQGAATPEQVADYCGLSPERVHEFFQLFARTEQVVTVYSQGVNQSSSGTDKVNAIINCHLATGRIGRPGMGPFSFTGQPNAMGGREVGALANQLAAHMEIADLGHRALLQRFWDSPTMCTEPGLPAVDLFTAIAAGKIKAVWIMSTNPVVSLPDADRVREALQRCPLVVVSDCQRHTDTTDCADILLPALTWGEKDGTVTNSERRISRQRNFLSAPGEARPDWWMVCEVARRMGFSSGFSYDTPREIFVEHAELSGHQNEGRRDFDISALSHLDAAAYQDLAPLQWPLNAARPAGTARLFSDGRFFTPTGRARCISVVPRRPQYQPDGDFPLILNTGRVRDQWHTMTRTGKAPRLAEHAPEPFVEMHTEDAAAHALEDGDLARVFSRWGEVIVRVRVSDAQRPGNVFVPMHWNGQYASHARVDALVNPAVDPLSAQPEFKHTPVRVQHYRPAWYGFLLTRRPVTVPGADYWARAAGTAFFRYELAGEQRPEDWSAWARAMLCRQDDGVNWVELLDHGAGRYRGIRMVSGRVESCIFIAPDRSLPSRNWLASLFAKERLDANEHLSLLTGQSPDGQREAGRVVCSCFGVEENTLLALVREQGLQSAAAIGRVCNAGTNCGSCIPEINALLQRKDGAA